MRRPTGVSSGWRRPSTRLRCVIGEPLRLRRWKGCLRIDLDERIAEPQKTREEPQTVIAGGSWRIPEVQNFAKRAYGALQAIIHRHFEVLKWVIIQENSSDLGHYFCHPLGRKFSLHIYWTPPTRADADHRAAHKRDATALQEVQLPRQVERRLQGPGQPPARQLLARPDGSVQLVVPAAKGGVRGEWLAGRVGSQSGTRSACRREVL